jgi:hypothetical protein
LNQMKIAKENPEATYEKDTEEMWENLKENGI